ncbi:HD domain-containing phosphohydrolase [Rhodoferax sp. GW822-FHT02A01]|uniref:HD-GYP domain-containing protein n=1 Tax=Rhodoferax sp. GW822-FHT02A01 TaxID=3141537 RepID=UPI00315C4F52
MNTDEFDFVALDDLRVGLFVDLNLGWLAHPFSSSRFKITTERQIDTLKSLGVDRIRYVPARSDPIGSGEPSPAASALSASFQPPAPEKTQAATAATKSALKAGQCERRFTETTQQYRQAMEWLQTDPKNAAQLCQDMVQSLTSEMLTQGDVAIRLLTEAAGDKSAMHPVNVAVISLLLGKALGVQGTALDELGLAAFLHDMGKIKLPERVRRWESNFSSGELKVYQDHVVQGVELARHMGLSAGTVRAIAQHHEMVDGSGFPQHLKGDAMTLNARILALVNRYDGLCNPGKLSAAMTPHEALSTIFSQQKTRFDANVLSAFIRMMGVYPPGSVVQLNDERHAMVVSVNSARPLKPRILVHEPTVPRHQAAVLDLELAPNTSIRRSLKPSSLPATALDYLQPRQRICYFYEPALDSEAAALNP